MEAWWVCSTVVADSHHFDEEHDPDPHLSDADPKLLQTIAFAL
jgi:hypothetical protein